MEARKCPNGHFYDPEKFSTCPVCAESSNLNGTTPIGGTMPLDTGFETVPPTEPFTGGASVTPAYDDKDLGKTAPIGTMSTKPMTEEYDATTPWDEANLGFTPTVGWVVCIRGPHKGQDFKLVTGYNKIGRSHDMAICLPKDEQVSRDSHAIVIFEPQSRKFFAKGDNNLIYINGEFQDKMQELHANDIIKAGASELIFVPLCGEAFGWDD